MPAPPSFLEAIRHILALKARRTWNRFGVLWRPRRRSPSEGAPRTGSPRRTRGGGVLAWLVFGLIFFTSSQQCTQAVLNVAGRLGSPADVQRASSMEFRRHHRAARDAAGSEDRPRVILTESSRAAVPPRRPGLEAGVAFLAGLLVLSMIFSTVGFGTGDLARLDLDVEWLLTMPVPVPLIYAAKVAERVVLNMFGWFTLAPLYGALLRFRGRSAAEAVAGAVALTLISNLLVAVPQFALEVSSRRCLAPHVRRNAQAFASLVGTVLFLLAFSVCMPVGREEYFLYDWIRGWGAAALQMPMGLGVRLFADAEPAPAWRLLAGLAAEIGVVMLGGALLIEWAARRGLEAVQSGYRGARKARSGPGGELLPGIAGKELRLVWRDKALFVSVAVLPLVIVGMQILFQPRFLEHVVADPAHWGAFTFGIGAYALLSVLGVLLHEQGALWLLYTVPRSLLGMVFEKVWIWVGLAFAYSLVAFAYGVWRRGAFVAEDGLALAWVAVGLPLCGIVGAALGVVGTDPLAVEPRDRMRKDLVYLYLMLAGLLAAGMYWPGAWPKFVSLVLFGALAAALWQRAGQRVAALLDPAAAAPRYMDAADGLIAVVVFGFLQGVVFAVLASMPTGLSTEGEVSVSYTVAGGASVLITSYVLWREGVRSREPILFWKGRGLGRSVAAGLAAGVAAAAVGAFYLWLRRGSLAHGAAPPGTLVLLMVVAAPVFEEILFRGFVFRGLRLGTRFLPAAVLSAATFAVVHPAFSFVPVFTLGLLAAWVYESTGVLLAPILAHAVYNGIVAALQ